MSAIDDLVDAAVNKIFNADDVAGEKHKKIFSVVEGLCARFNDECRRADIEHRVEAHDERAYEDHFLHRGTSRTVNGYHRMRTEIVVSKPKGAFASFTKKACVMEPEKDNAGYKMSKVAEWSRTGFFGRSELTHYPDEALAITSVTDFLYRHALNDEELQKVKAVTQSPKP